MAAFGVGVTIQSNALDLSGVFAKLANDQIPFAATVALTRLAQDVKVAEAEDLPKRLKTHGNRLVRGLRVKRAEKRDWPNPKAEVGSLDDFLVLQELGGTKTAQTGASHVAIPARYVAARRRAATGRFPVRILPKNIPKSRKIEGKELRATISEGGEKKDRIFWFLRRSVHIKPRLKFRETAERTSKAKYGEHFQRELSAALKSARVRAGRFTTEQGRTVYLKALESLR